MRVGGSIIREKSCDPGYHADTLVGADLFIMLFPGNEGGYPNCNAFQACATASCAGLSEPGLTDCWNTCSAQTEASCEAGREAALLDSAFSWVVPWGDTLDFGDPAHQISSADLGVLETVNTCLARSPPTPALACHDTVNSGPAASRPSRPDTSTTPLGPVSPRSSASRRSCAVAVAVKRSRRGGLVVPAYCRWTA